MPGRPCPQAEVVGGLLTHPETAQVIVNHNPKWALQRKGRNEHDEKMKEKHVLQQGFGPFYNTAENPAMLQLGDTCRRHLATRPDGQEAQWRSTCRFVQPVEHPVRAHGKRTQPQPSGGPSYTTDSGEVVVVPRPTPEEVSDLPRGKKRVAPPKDQLPESSAMFELPRTSKGTVRDPDTGGRVADKMSDLDAKDAPRGLRRPPPGSNQAAAAASGGSPIRSTAASPTAMAAAQQSERLASQQYAATRTAAAMEASSGGGGGATTTRLPPIDRFSAAERQRQRRADIDQVRGLPMY